MADPFIGEIRPWALNFAPFGWSFCEGQIMNIQQSTALFSILGVTYGGDGKTTFNLPDLKGRAPMHMGRGPGLSTRTLGQKTGDENVALTTSQIPPHYHAVMAKNINAGTASPGGAMLAKSGKPSGGRDPLVIKSYVPGAPGVQMATSAISGTGSGQAHFNMQPFTVVNMCIALQGLYPVRS